MGPDNGETPKPIKQMTRRQMLINSLSGLSALSTIPLFLRSDAPDATTVVAKKDVENLRSIIDKPTDAELATLKADFEAECKEAFTHEKQTFIKEYRGTKYVITSIKTRSEEGNESYALMVRKPSDNKDIGDVVIYNHSIEGLNFDVKTFYEDFSEIWNKNGVLVFPLMQGYLHDLPSVGSNDKNFFSVKDNDGKEVDLTNTHGWFSEFSPAQSLRPISALFEEIPEIKDKKVELLGISLGASTGIGIATSWNTFGKHHFLPELSKASLYAPAYTLLDEKILFNSLQDGDMSKQLGIHRIFRSFVQGQSYSIQRYLEKRYYVQKQPLIDGRWIAFVKDRGDEKKGIQPNKIIEFEGGKDEMETKLQELKKIYHLSTQLGNEITYELGYTNSVSENLQAFARLRAIHPEGYQKLRENLIRFSPQYMLQMADATSEFPINLVWANMDSIVPPEQSIRLADDLRKRGADVRNNEIFGGHYMANPQIFHMPQYLRSL